MTTPIRGQAVFTQINQERAAAKLPALRPSAALVKAAQAKADDMAKRGYFSHAAPDGKNLWSFIGTGSGYKSAGENLAEGFNDVESLKGAWVASPKHKANILDKTFTDTGIAMATTKDGKQIIVQLFGSTK